MPCRTCELRRHKYRGGQLDGKGDMYGAVMYDVHRILGFLVPLSSHLTTKSILFIHKIGASFEPPPISLRTSFMKAPYGGEREGSDECDVSTTMETARRKHLPHGGKSGKEIS